ncbi:DUF4862 family protein [Mobiluncus mulieris]|uniref:DUF4862 family protein n=1 Tax=Mobiluncus mulieris TaxID=2052 RepID=UPI00019F952E|nr:DUF4862 family protein [Mobiluncus mulieris]EEJ52864.1 hypothetical protein HMPREF0577_2177 [Mobiluncus mulieris ATCC 35243]MCU9970700.1 DUF4862 family protein [Mobiluncus mulieris]MCU9995745.1 DUF4862 family protein [Mobiluncus mulieris]MCV0001840.1 DUF4862 family protein [Mobiluncus mulieris]NMW90678.1 DUF4862 family protein [Mobiluncus mulieris]
MELPFVVGAYASLPAPEMQADYYRLLAETPWVSGIEIPYPGVLASNPGDIAAVIAPHWHTNTITAIPGTMQNVGKNPHFGLASPNEAGRQAAVNFTREIRDAVARLAELTGRAVITKVQLHSAPTREADAAAFRRSLDQLCEWDWNGAQPVVEHCDRYLPTQAPEKGFLALEAEIAICRELGLGVHLNWGRSVVEGRSTQTAFDHIKACAEAGVLAGLMFSGAGPAETQYGYAWIDGHLPASSDEPASLLAPHEIARCAAAAQTGGTKYLGAKICVPPTATLPQRVAMLENIYRAALG